MKIAIVIYSKTGTTQKVAELIGAGIGEVEGCEYQIMQLDALDKDYLAEATTVLFGTPTYYANMCWQMKRFFDEGGVNLANKLAGVFATANVIGGGAETALLAMINHILVKGMLVYSAGASKGQPITHLGVTYVHEVPMEQQEKKICIFGKRMAEKTKELFAE